MNRIPEVGEAVELIADPFYSRNPFKKGDRGIVTGRKVTHGKVTDVVINGDGRNSVDHSRVVGLGKRIYRMTDQRGREQENVAGTLLDSLQPGDLFVVYACDLTGRHANQGICLRYLTKPQRGLHYCDEHWINMLLDCGAIVLHANPLAHEVPFTYTSIKDVPRGMVVQYLIEGHQIDAMLYPYVYRSMHGVYAFSRAQQRWVYVDWECVKNDHPWMLDLPTEFGQATLTEAFVYPRLPHLIETQQRALINA